MTYPETLTGGNGKTIATLHHPRRLVRKLSYSRPLRIDARDLIPGDIYFGMADGSATFEQEGLEYPDGVTIERASDPNRGAIRFGFVGVPYDFEIRVNAHTLEVGQTDGIPDAVEWFAAPVWAKIAMVGPAEYE